MQVLTSPIATLKCSECILQKFSKCNAWLPYFVLGGILDDFVGSNLHMMFEELHIQN